MRLTKQAKATNLEGLKDGAVYMFFGQLVEARLKHTWLFFILDDEGEYRTVDGATESYMLQEDGLWKVNSASSNNGRRLEIIQEDICFLAESRERLDIDKRFREIMAVMEWN